MIPEGSQVRDGKESVKFMQVLDRRIFFKLKDMAKSRGVTVQELIRVLVIPDWMRKSQEENRRTEDRRRHRRLAGPACRPAEGAETGGAGRRQQEGCPNRFQLVGGRQEWRAVFFFAYPPERVGNRFCKQ